MPNLCDALSASGARRRFFLPVAAIAPGRDATRDVDPVSYSFAETRPAVSATDPTTADVKFSIVIRPSNGSFTPEDDLPDPALRVHAMDGGILGFDPQGDRLVLTMMTFLQPLHHPGSGGVRWWERWVEARRLPVQLEYENVDRAQLAARLASLPPASDPSTEAPAHLGLRLPRGTTAADKDAFVAGFLAGEPARALLAEPGAYLGTAGADPSTAPPNRILHLHLRYQDDTPSAPNPMSPREFFSLLFGDDSPEARTHPLLRRMDALAQTQTDQPETRRMSLRPPLRTAFRVWWEAEQEIRSHPENWGSAGSLVTENGEELLFNTLVRRDMPFDRTAYTGSFKCNLFASDMAVRSGFRVAVLHTLEKVWHYVDANTSANSTHCAGTDTARVAIQGVRVDRKKPAPTWAWKTERWWQAVPAADRRTALHDAMAGEGRCFLLAGAKPRKFAKKTVPINAAGVAPCTAALKKVATGHIMIVRDVTADPIPHDHVGSGFTKITADTYQAASEKALRTTSACEVGGAGPNPGSAKGYIRLHLVELAPGGDPDTVQGLADLNVESRPWNLLGTADEAARKVPIVLPNGQPPPNVAPQCCFDNHPTAEPATIQKACAEP